MVSEFSAVAQSVERASKGVEVIGAKPICALILQN